MGVPPTRVGGHLFYSNCLVPRSPVPARKDHTLMLMFSQAQGHSLLVFQYIVATLCVYCSVVADNAIKPLVFMQREVMSILLGYRNVLNLVYFWAFQNLLCLTPLSHTN